MAADADAEVAYLRVGALCDAIKAELDNDLKIHEHDILPHFINLPQVTAGEYCRVSTDTLTSPKPDISHEGSPFGKYIQLVWLQLRGSETTHTSGMLARSSHCLHEVVWMRSKANPPSHKIELH